MHLILFLPVLLLRISGILEMSMNGWLLWRRRFFLLLLIWKESETRHSLTASQHTPCQSASGKENISYNFEEISALTFSWGLTSVISSSTVSIVSPSCWDQKSASRSHCLQCRQRHLLKSRSSLKQLQCPWSW